MRSFLKNALLGALLGGGVAALITALRPDDDADRDDDPTMVVVRGATFGALGAVTLGWLRDRRRNKKAEEAREEEPAVMRFVHDVVDGVSPHVEDGLDRLGDVAEAARDRAEAARDRAEALVS